MDGNTVINPLTLIPGYSTNHTYTKFYGKLFDQFKHYKWFKMLFEENLADSFKIWRDYYYFSGYKSLPGGEKY